MTIEQTMESRINKIVDTLSLMKMQISSIQQEIKQLEKSARKEIKKQSKENVKKVVKRGPKKPSGFAKPSKVSKELCDFMNKPEGTEIARTEVTKELVQYIKTHNLQEQCQDSKKNKIVPDNKLKKLLDISNDELDTLNFFTIQKYMNKHFISKKISESSESVMVLE